MSVGNSTSCLLGLKPKATISGPGQQQQVTAVSWQHRLIVYRTVCSARPTEGGRGERVLSFPGGLGSYNMQAVAPVVQWLPSNTTIPVVLEFDSHRSESLK